MVGHLCRMLTEVGHRYGAEMTIIVVNPADPAERLVISNTTSERAVSQIRGVAGCTEAADFVSVPGHLEPN